MNFRSRELLRLAYQMPCTLRIEGVCHGGMGEPAHSNQSRHGKGAGMKAHDCFFASACRACHREIDQGSRLTKDERREIWQRGFELTLLTLWDNNLIQTTWRGAEPVMPDGLVYQTPDGREITARKAKAMMLGPPYRLAKRPRSPGRSPTATPSKIYKPVRA